MNLAVPRYKLLTIVGALLAMFALTLTAPPTAVAQNDDFQFNFPEDAGDNPFEGMNDEEAAEAAAGLIGFFLAFGLIIIVVFLLIYVVVKIVIIILVTPCFKRVPQEHRKMEGGLVWLWIIPCLDLVWSFIVVIKLADSYKSYFNAAGRTDVGDCGKGLGIAAAAVYAAAGILPNLPIPIPFLGLILFIAAVVLFIVWLVKSYGLKNQIPAGGGGAAPPPAAAPPMG